MTASVEIKNLSKSFGHLKAVDGISFSVQQGEVLGFLGPNGAGKSTTMKMLTGFLAPTSGTAVVCGHDVLEQPLQVKKVIGYLPEGAPSYGEMSPRGYLSFVGEVRGLKGEALRRAVGRAMDLARLQDVQQQRIETLSKGYKRRVGIAQAILHDPAVLVLDEPTDGLDPNQKHEMRQLIREMGRDKVIILSTHILEEVDAVCTRAIVIAHGKLLADGTPESYERRGQAAAVHRVAVGAPDPTEVQAALEGVEGVARVELQAAGGGQSAFNVFARPGAEPAAALAQAIASAGWELHELHRERARLDEVFRQITQGGARPSGSPAREKVTA